MNNKKFSAKIEETFDNLTEEEKKSFLEKYNFKYKLLVSIFSIIFFALISLIVLLIATDFQILVFIFLLIFLILDIISIVGNAITLKASDSIKIKDYIKQREQRKDYNKSLKQDFKLKFLGQFDTSNIKSVVIIDSYTEMSDKLHAILNYQEIIQTRYYKFMVNYFDGSYQIITAKEASPEYNALIGFIGRDVSNEVQNAPQTDNTDLILKYKKLLDEGIITQEEFEKKKKELL